MDTVIFFLFIFSCIRKSDYCRFKIYLPLYSIYPGKFESLIFLIYKRYFVDPKEKELHSYFLFYTHLNHVHACKDKTAQEKGGKK